jgi:Domain of unknown function (DUF5668)
LRVAGRYRPTIDRHTLAQFGRASYRAVMDFLENRMNQQSSHRLSRGRLTGGIILLIIGSVALAANLGIHIPRDWWEYAPWILVGLGAVQLAWPGNLSARLNGFWLVAVGFILLICINEWFGLHWFTAWPLFVIALGIRIVLTSLLSKQPKSSDNQQ